MSQEPSDARIPLLYEEHRAAGARFVAYAGWKMPISFSGVLDEHHAVRKSVGVFDVSHMGRFLFRGPQALADLDRLTVSDLRSLAVGTARYTCCCNEEGGIVDDVIVYRLEEELLLFVCNASNASKMWAHATANRSEGTSMEDVTLQTALFAVQGPLALAVVEDVLGVSGLRGELAPFGVRRMLAGGHEIWVARTGYTGEDGCELMVAGEHAIQLWQALRSSSASPEGVKPIGLAARDTLRLEARLSLYGNEIDETTHPFEAGLRWLVQLDGAPFIGKAALVALSQTPLTRRLVGFEMRGRAIARSGYRVLSQDGVELGHCTSGGPAPTLGKNVGLAYVKVDHAGLGTGLQVDCRGRLADAVVVKTPFYRRQTRQ